MKIGVSTFSINIVGGLIFGIAKALQVVFGTGDSAWWLMPLIIAPIEYLFVFGLPIIAYYIGLTSLVLYIMRKKNSNKGI